MDEEREAKETGSEGLGGVERSRGVGGEGGEEGGGEEKGRSSSVMTMSSVDLLSSSSSESVSWRGEMMNGRCMGVAGWTSPVDDAAKCHRGCRMVGGVGGGRRESNRRV